MTIQNALDELKQKGLNLFAVTKTCDLPDDIKQLMQDQGIEMSLAKNEHLCLFAHGGTELWKHLPHPMNEEEHPVDRYSISMITNFAQKVWNKDIKVLFPGDQYVVPLQRIGRHLNLSRPSLLGLDINKDYGPWFAFRGVFLIEAEIDHPKLATFESPCERCQDKPCLNACPAGAVTKDNFILKSCATYRISEQSKCETICLARLACPYQAQHRYSDEQITYHMGRAAHIKKLASYA